MLGACEFLLKWVSNLKILLWCRLGRYVCIRCGYAAGLGFVLKAYGGIRSTGGVKLCVVVLICM